MYWALLIFQIVLVAACLVVVLSVLLRFPWPSPLIRPLLRPALRWPEKQIRFWIEQGRIRPDFLAFFSRDPDRVIPPGNNVVAPADGVINDIFVHDGKTYVVIALSFWDVHVQRSPVEGGVVDIRRGGNTYMDFEWQDAAFLRDKPCPVQAIIMIRTPRNDPVEVRLITSYAARRINVLPGQGDTLKKGERLGNITFGSTVTLAIPASWPLSSSLHEHVTAGESIIATTTDTARLSAAGWT
jgi:phosphatidylserine decarboxylase